MKVLTTQNKTPTRRFR